MKSYHAYQNKKPKKKRNPIIILDKDYFILGKDYQNNRPHCF